LPRILIDVTRLLYRRVTGTLPTGIDRVSLAYIGHYPGARAVLSLGPFSAILSEGDSREVLDRLPRDERVLALAARVVAKAFLWRWLAPAAPGDVLLNTGHTGLENRHYATMLRRCGARLVVVVHDLIPISHPQFSRPREQARHRVRMCVVASRAAAVIVNSQDTAGALRDFARSEGIALGALHVALLGPGLPRHPTGPRPLDEPYFLVLGTLERRKNHALLLDVWARWGAGAPRLVVIGQPGAMSDAITRRLGASPALRARVLHLERCSDVELCTWMHHANALLLPSFAEGFGLPLLEAVSRTVPAIASDLQVFREVAGPVPDYLDPRDRDGWERLLHRYALADGPERRAQIERARRYSPPDWQRHFRVVDGVIESMREPRP
jgi:glycosyltransferase involved in cell wall biosynthesis